MSSPTGPVVAEMQQDKSMGGVPLVGGLADIVHCGCNDCRYDCETLLSTATGASRYNGYVALTGDRQPSDHEAAIF